MLAMEAQALHVRSDWQGRSPPERGTAVEEQTHFFLVSLWMLVLSNTWKGACRSSHSELVVSEQGVSASLHVWGWKPGDARARLHVPTWVCVHFNLVSML
jgi:hypothetical protein